MAHGDVLARAEIETTIIYSRLEIFITLSNYTTIISKSIKEYMYSLIVKEYLGSKIYFSTQVHCLS